MSDRWTERQQALLQGLGLRVWGPPVDAIGQADPVEPAEPVVVGRPGPAMADESQPAVPQRPGPPGASPAVQATAAAAPETVPPAPAPQPATGPVARMDWPTLRQAVADCRACGLCESRTQTVFGVGHERAHWMIVGEAPGEQEDKAGEPFVGPAGHLLDGLLQALGLGRQPGEPASQVFIANTLKCRPPRNRNPAPEELARCAPFLARQVALVQPRVILAMGRFAIQQVLGTDEAVGRLRGRIHQYQGVPVVVSYHPAYLLRQPSEKAKAWEDLCLAASVLGWLPPRA